MTEDNAPSQTASQPFRVDAHGVCKGDCGDSIEMFLELKKETIGRVAFQCDGCMSTYMAARGLAELVQDAPLNKALTVTAVDVINHLDALEEDHEHCAVIAVNALHEAVTYALRTRQEPWKRLYRPRK